MNTVALWQSHIPLPVRAPHASAAHRPLTPWSFTRPGLSRHRPFPPPVRRCDRICYIHAPEALMSCAGKTRKGRPLEYCACGASLHKSNPFLPPASSLFCFLRLSFFFLFSWLDAGAEVRSQPFPSHDACMTRARIPQLSTALPECQSPHSACLIVLCRPVWALDTAHRPPDTQASASLGCPLWTFSLSLSSMPIVPAPIHIRSSLCSVVSATALGLSAQMARNSPGGIGGLGVYSVLTEYLLVYARHTYPHRHRPLIIVHRQRCEVR